MRPKQRSPTTSTRPPRSSRLPRRRATTREASRRIRTCVGCGRRSPQDELDRYASVEGVLMPGRTLPGRGAYTCRDRRCFERAVACGVFPRAVRQPVTIEGLYTGRSDG